MMGAKIDAIDARLCPTPKMAPCSFGPTAWDIRAETEGRISPEPIDDKVDATSAMGTVCTKA